MYCLASCRRHWSTLDVKLTETGLQHVSTAVRNFYSFVLWLILYHFEHSSFFCLSNLPLILPYLVQCFGCGSQFSSGYGVVSRLSNWSVLCLMDRGYALLLGNTIYCVTDRFLCPWPHFACWFSSSLHDTFSFRLVKLCKHYNLTQHICRVNKSTDDGTADCPHHPSMAQIYCYDPGLVQSSACWGMLSSEDCTGTTHHRVEC